MSPPSDKCIKCAKLCLEGQNCIQCDKCDGWIHLKCSGIRLKDFKNMTKNTEFVCIFCTNYPCGKCSKPVYNTQNAINCSIDVCSKWFHLRCTPFSLADYLNRKSRLHTEHWFCPDCMGMPFNDLTDIEFCEFIHDELKLREYFNILAGNTDFSNKCSVCNKRVNDDQKPKCIPCISCNCLVHKKCSNIKLTDLLYRCYADVRWEYSINLNRKSDVKNPQTSLGENSNTFRQFFRFKNGKKNRKLQFYALPAISDTCGMVATWAVSYTHLTLPTKA